MRRLLPAVILLAAVVCAMADDAARKGFVVVTDFVPADGKSDVADVIQKVINTHPNRTIYFPDGTYLLSKPIATPAEPTLSVDLQLSNYAILKAAQGKDPGSMLLSATYDARALMADSGTYRTNKAAKAVALADSLSMRASRLADVWIPVREVIAQSVTNEEQASTILAQIGDAQSKTKAAARQLSDLDAESYSTMCEVEGAFNRFLKLTAMPPAAIGEDLVAQSNAWQDVEEVNSRPWQKEALDYTRAFRQKFPAWAKAYETQAQSDTNKPPFTAEDQAKISAMSTELEKIQMKCCEKNLPPLQEEAIGLLIKIRDLLPKDNKGGGQGQQQNSPQQNQQQDQQQQNEQQDQQQDEQQSQQQDDQQEQQQQQEEAQEEKNDQEVEAVLRKAQERNDEHEAEKKARMRKAPLPPNERDW